VNFLEEQLRTSPALDADEFCASARDVTMAVSPNPESTEAQRAAKALRVEFKFMSLVLSD